MQQIRIGPCGREFGIDVVCDCGRNGLINIETGQGDFSHQIQLDGPDVTLECVCGSKIVIHPQGTHFHVVQK